MNYYEALDLCIEKHKGHPHEKMFRDAMDYIIKSCHQSPEDENDTQAMEIYKQRDQWTLDEWFEAILNFSKKDNQDEWLSEIYDEIVESFQNEFDQNYEIVTTLSWDLAGMDHSGYDIIGVYAGAYFGRDDFETIVPFEDCQGLMEDMDTFDYAERDGFNLRMDPDYVTPEDYNRYSTLILKKNLNAHVHFLTELNPARNWMNAESLKQASGYIADHFAEYGLPVHRQTWMADGREYDNVVARYTSPRPLERNEARPLLVVGAHYDVAGDQPGADDNASAVAGLLETARLLAELKPDLAYDIELVGYCLEEPPFFGGSDMGSYVHAKSLHDAGIPVKGMICYEMIGYYSDEPGSQPLPDSSLVGLVPTVGNFIGVIGRPENGEFNQAFYQAMAKDSEIEVVGIGLPDQHFPSALSGLVGMSDQRNYWKFGYPALMINDTSFVRNPHYHQVTDTMDTLDFDRLTQAVNSAYRGIVGLPS